MHYPHTFDSIDSSAPLFPNRHDVGGAALRVRVEADRVAHLQDLALARQPHDAELVRRGTFHLD